MLCLWINYCARSLVWNRTKVGMKYILIKLGLIHESNSLQGMLYSSTAESSFAVLERIKEIGVMKAIGAKNSDIFIIFVFESGFLGLVAGIVGVLVGFGITSIAETFLDGNGWGFLSPYYSWELFIGCILFATFTGAISGIIPAWKASKIRTVNALRYE